MQPRIRQHMRLFTSVGILVLVLVLSGVTHAIFNGTLDGTLHPNVGLVVAQGSAGKFTPCTGNLIAPTVVVTAAHCLEFIQSRGGTQVWVTFDSQANVNTSPLIAGTMHPNPAFDPHAPDPQDIAVITLGTPVVGIAPVVLPSSGLLDELGYQNGLKDQLFTVVGYGANDRIEGGGPQTFVRDLNRRYATSGLDSLGQALMRLSMNAEQGFGGASFGDSGGAIFLGQSNTAVAIVGLRSTVGMYETYRLDIPSARAFLANFVTLPD